jgi:uncharacterized surface protein with fasciclin (FAS1) repeats
MKKLIVSLFAAALIGGVSTAVIAGNYDKEKSTNHAAAKQDIVDTAVGAGNFKTLATALQAAGLVDTLKGEGPFTVFAPTDEAFAKIPKAQLDALLADKAQLTKVLTYHVVAGKVKAADVMKMTDGRQVKTVSGASFTLGLKDGVSVDGAKVTATDIKASNGIIHVIDSVILPKS